MTIIKRFCKHIKKIVLRFAKGIIYICNLENIRKEFRFIKKYGLGTFLSDIFIKLYGRQLFSTVGGGETPDQIGNKILNEQQNESAVIGMAALIGQFKYKPLISVIIPVYNPHVKWLKAAIISLQAQSYTNWELRVADEGSNDPGGRRLLKRMSGMDKRIHITALEKNEGIYAVSNKAVEMAKGEFIAFMDHDDELTDDALFWIVKEINEHPDTDFMYSDECKFDCEKNKKYDFFCKPDWSPSLILNFMYVGHLTVYKTSLVRQIGGFRSGYDFSLDYDLVLRMSDIARKIRHVERILYYWRDIPGSDASGSKFFARETNTTTLKDWYNWKGIKAAVSDSNFLNDARPVLLNDFKVSIIIPSDNINNLTQCVKDLLKNTSYSDYEIVIVTNSRIADQLPNVFQAVEKLIICRYDKPFNFSDKCNMGAYSASGNVFCFYNDDVVPINKDWIERMLEILILPDIGGVTPIQLSNNNTILNAGLVLGTPGFQDFAFHGRDFAESRYLMVSPHMIRDISVMSGACFVIKKDIFVKIGGFDAVNTPNSFSDTDLSLRLMDNGYRCVCTPYSRVLHENKVSWSTTERPDKTFLYIMERWGKYLSRDIYFTDSMKKLYGMVSSDMYRYFAPLCPAVRKQGGRDILLISHELTLTGAPIVLMDMALFFLENGDWPVVISLQDGPLRQKYIEMGITVIIDKSICHTSTCNCYAFNYVARNFDLAVVNTIVCYRVISEQYNSLLPVLWWIHEGDYVLNSFSGIIPKTIGKNITVICGGNYSWKMLKKYNVNYETEILNYGIKDTGLVPYQSNLDRIKIILIGSYELRKGHDLFIKAIKTLPQTVLQKAEFIFSGGIINKKVYNKVVKFCKNRNNCYVYKTMPRADIYKLYDEASCIVCPSRDDPMPVVITEMMMKGKICIISEKVGHAQYIKDGENGFVFADGDIKTFSKKLEYVIINANKLQDIGKNARKVFLHNFEMNIFRKKFKLLLEKAIS